MDQKTTSAPLDLTTPRSSWGCSDPGRRRPGISLPPRKRRYQPAVEEEEEGEEEGEGEGALITRGERLNSSKEEAKRKRGLSLGPCEWSSPEPISISFQVPHHLQYISASPHGHPSHPHPVVTKPYYMSHLPLYPVATHPLALGTLTPYHPPACHFFISQGDILPSDIAVAMRQDEDGDTPLHIAVVQGDMQVVQTLVLLLLNGERSLDIFNNLRQTPLHLAVITRHAAITTLLVSSGACPSIPDRHGQSSLHLACEHGSIACLRALLPNIHPTADLDLRNYEGYSPLHVAVNNQDREVVTFLLERGADIDAADIKSGRTSLVHAVENDCKELVQILLQHGASVNLQTYAGNTALHSASGRGLLDIVKILLHSGADASIKNCHNDTSLMVAKNKKVVDVLRGKATRLSAPLLPDSKRLTLLWKPGSPRTPHLHGGTGSTHGPLGSSPGGHYSPRVQGLACDGAAWIPEGERGTSPLEGDCQRTLRGRCWELQVDEAQGEGSPPSPGECGGLAGPKIDPQDAD
ncbi:B-cell lymphoma 3 protein [Narcine bancroftii]|uniref:B-cell lymphoma 3 protein n=1 Tax=Narcine bancroftii TaxID=1343680 RepID=UPI0038323229